MKKGDLIYWDKEIWKVNTEHQLIRVSDGCQYNSGMNINDTRSKIYNNAFLLVKIKV